MTGVCRVLRWQLAFCAASSASGAHKWSYSTLPSSDTAEARPIEGFIEGFSDAPPALDLTRHAIFVDLDGTLVEIEERPEDVVGDPELSRLLGSVAKHVDGAVALVTGRTVEDAQRIVRGSIDNIAGVHGADLRRGQSVVQAPLARSDMGQIFGIVSGLVAAGALSVVVENKGHSIGLHFRHAPQVEQDVFEIASDLANRHGVRLLKGKMVFELMPIGVDKGAAVVEFMRLPPFAGRLPIAIGDDITDEDAFETVRALGGFAVLVGADRPSAAKYRLADVAAVRQWMADGLELVFE